MGEAHRNRLLAWRSMLYVLVNVFPSALGLLILPVVTRVVTPTEYGLFSLYASIITGVLVCLEFSLIIRKAYVKQEDGNALSETLSACLIVYSVVLAVVLLPALWAWDWLTPYKYITRPWLALAIGTAFLQALMTLAYSLWQISQHAKIYCLFKLLFTLSYTSIMLFATFVLEFGWRGMSMSLTMASIITFVLSLYPVFRLYTLRWRFNRARLAQVRRDVLGLMPFRVAVAIFTYGGPFLVAYGTDPRQSGFYMFAYQVCLVIALGYDSILASMLPHLVAPAGSEHAFTPEMRRRNLLYYVGLVGLASLGIAVVGPYVVYWLFPANYAPAAAFIAWLALARFFHGLNRMVQELCFFNTERFRTIAFISLFMSLVYVWLTVVLIREFGSIGGGMGMAAGHALWLAALLIYRAAKNASIKKQA